MTFVKSAQAAYSLAEVRDPDAVSQALRQRGVALDAREVALLPELLGRAPLWAEAVLFGILWSEHCSYKSTRHLLDRLPTTAPQVLIGPGEDAGVVSLPAPCQDLVLILAHESHNHPSQVLPVEGAATGVGGIVRDVECMGGTVTGIMDALRFGDPRSGVVVRDIVRGVVRGIADYGNALGVPNLGGDACFSRRFDANCLVNVMAVGVCRRDGVVHSRVPEGPEPFVFVLVGKPTDESGFGGAAFASEGLAEEGDRRGAVQLPDPFLARALAVANARAFERIRERGIRAGFKDLGAGGVACATSEMAAAGGRGADIVLDDVHHVARALPPEVLLCAETQERYCWAVPETFAGELCAIYEETYALGEIHPGAGARVIGRAVDAMRYRVTWRGEIVVDCPVEAITAGRRETRPSRRRAPGAPRKLRRALPEFRAALLQLLRSYDGCSREYLYRHYDSEVQGRTWLRPGEGDAVVFAPAPGRVLGVALALGGNPYWCETDPELGARHAVAEAARNVACVGGRPWALTDCLNFGNPEDPDVMGDFEATLAGLAVAAESLGGLASPGAPLPFVSGNVSLYNETGSRAIPPAPIVMCAGVVQDPLSAVGQAVRTTGSFLVLVGEPRDTLTGSMYLREVIGEASAGAPPALDLPREARLQELAVLAAEGQWVRAAHDVSDGGLGMTLVEMLLAAPPDAVLGAEIDLGPLETTPTLALFSERPGIVFEVAPERAPRFYQAARERQLFAWPIGTVTSTPVLRVGAGDVDPVEWRVEELRDAAAVALAALWNEEVE